MISDVLISDDMMFSQSIDWLRQGHGSRGYGRAPAQPAGTWRGTACSSFVGLSSMGGQRPFGLSAEGVASNAPPIGEADLFRGGCYDGP